MSNKPPASPLGPNDNDASLDRRDFFKLTGAGAGLLALGSCTTGGDELTPGLVPPPKITFLGGSRSDVVVVGAGLWGSFAAYNLRKRGARVTLVDQHGPGNSRATSGDETRGVRSTYGERGETGELWMLWARESMKRWQEFDKEWAKYWKIEVYAKTGDLTFRPDDSAGIIKTTREWWDKYKIPYSMVPVDVVAKEYPVINLEGIGAIMLEPEAGVLRARRAAQYAAAALEKMGGRVVIGRAKSLTSTNGTLEEIELDTGEKLRADLFVFALGPWMRTYFPDVLGERMNTPLAQVCYFSPPAGDQRFTFPNMPSYNFPGVTGWPALPVDSRGFRVRGGRAAPQTAGGAAGGGAGGRGGTGGGRGGRGGTGGGRGGTALANGGGGRTGGGRTGGGGGG
ncbi:MAG TPA: FAD-dependent oxidoreductase, partial [Gemmatimonadaceae bacterium]|nr:FAD-dependent oxidoreductase [Gemmatimonadaceae bacterium]